MKLRLSSIVQSIKSGGGDNLSLLNLNESINESSKISMLNTNLKESMNKLKSDHQKLLSDKRGVESNLELAKVQLESANSQIKSLKEESSRDKD